MAIFLFHYPPRKETFAFEVLDEGKIEQARMILRGTPQGGTHVQGTIVKEPVEFNTPWSFHLEPMSVDFFELAAEVCDAGIRFVEDHLEDVGGDFLPGNCWCPWGSELIAEIGSARGCIATDPRQACWRLDEDEGGQVRFVNPAADCEQGAEVKVYYRSLPTRLCPRGDNHWTAVISASDDCAKSMKG